jgi:hypothetical protein
VSILRDVRKQRRFEMNRPMTWTIPGESEGHATLVNVSLGGACIRIVGSFSPTRTRALHLCVPSIPNFPRAARLRWFRKVAGREPVTFCGVTFDDVESNRPSWIEWLQAQESVDVPPPERPRGEPRDRGQPFAHFAPR